MNRGRVFAISASICAAVLASYSHTSALPIYVDDVQGSFVSVEPLLGNSPRPIRVFLSTAERRTLQQLEVVTSKVKNRRQIGDSLVRWHIEPSALVSPTMLLQRRVLYALREMLEGADGALAPVEVVAVTVNACGVSLTNPLTVQLVTPVVVQVNPPGLDVTE